MNCLHEIFYKWNGIRSLIFLSLCLLISTSGLLASEQSIVKNYSGIIFTTLKQRNNLDRIRRVTHGRNVNKNVQKKKEKSDDSSHYTLRGFVKRTNGNNIVWINDDNTSGKKLSEYGLKVNTRSIRSDKVYVSLAGKKFRLKPGQSIESSTGKVIENYLIKD